MERKKISIAAQKYWINRFARMAFDGRYAWCRGLNSHQKIERLAEHLPFFFKNFELE